MTLIEALANYIKLNRTSPHCLFRKKKMYQLRLLNYTGWFCNYCDGDLISYRDVENDFILVHMNGLLYIPSMQDFLANDWIVQRSHYSDITKIGDELEVKPWLTKEVSVSIRAE